MTFLFAVLVTVLMTVLPLAGGSCFLPFAGGDFFVGSTFFLSFSTAFFIGVGCMSFSTAFFIGVGSASLPLLFFVPLFLPFESSTGSSVFSSTISCLPLLFFVPLFLPFE